MMTTKTLHSCQTHDTHLHFHFRRQRRVASQNDAMFHFFKQPCAATSHFSAISRQMTQRKLHTPNAPNTPKFAVFKRFRFNSQNRTISFILTPSRTRAARQVNPVYLMYPARSRPTHSGTLPLAGGTPPLTPPGLLSVPWLVCRGGCFSGRLGCFSGLKKAKNFPGDRTQLPPTV